MQHAAQTEEITYLNREQKNSATFNDLHLDATSLKETLLM